MLPLLLSFSSIAETMNQQPLLSIVVPIYNVEQYLAQCIESLVNQTYRNIEIICVDDGSPDKSIDILNRYASKDSRVKVFQKRNGGQSDARNYGLTQISGDYFMFVDGDDWLDLDTCKSAVQAIVKHNTDCLMFSYTKEFAKSSVPVSIFDEDKYYNREQLRHAILRRTFGPVSKELIRPEKCDITVSACMQLFNSNLLKDIRFHDIRTIGTFEDGLYQIDVFSRCSSFMYLNKPYYHYRKTNIDSTTSKYNPDLHSRWKTLFNVLYEKSVLYANSKDEQKNFEEAINNRIALSILPLGLNVSRADISLKSKQKLLKSILDNEVYANSLKSLPLKYLSLPWKVIFTLAKNRRTFYLVCCFSAIEYLRTHAPK